MEVYYLAGFNKTMIRVNRFAVNSIDRVKLVTVIKFRIIRFNLRSGLYLDDINWT